MKIHRFVLSMMILAMVVSISTLTQADDDMITLPLDAASGVIRGDAIPGGELDYRAEKQTNGTITLELVWDGMDSAPDKLDHSGLGGISLNRNCTVTEGWNEFDHTVRAFNDQGTALSDGFLDSSKIGSLWIQIQNLEVDTDLEGLANSAADWFRLESLQITSNRELISATLIVQEGDTPTGSGGRAVDTLNNPFTNGPGEVGFTGSLADTTSDHFVWSNDEIVWTNSMATSNTLTGAEATMGIGDNGEFIYSPSTDSLDSVWTHDGMLLQKSQQAPGMATGTLNTFNSRPIMVPSGNAFWIAGFDDTGGTSTKGRMCYKSTDYNPANIVPLLKSDDLVGGIPVDRPSGIGFDFMVSDVNENYIQEVLLDTGSTANDGIIYLNGNILARESEPAPNNDNWDNFDRMVVNSSGSYAFSGDTDGNTGGDEFICYNGNLVIQEGDTIAGVELVAGSSLNVLSINNTDRLIHQWSVNSVDTLFLTCNPLEPDSTSFKLMAAGDTVDLTGDMIADATITDLNASGGASFGYWLAEDGFLYAEVDLDYGAGEIEAIIKLELPECGPGPCVNHGDVNLDGSITAGDAQLAFQITLGSYTPTFEEECAADCNGDESVTAGDAQQIFYVVLGTGSCEDPV